MANKPVRVPERFESARNLEVNGLKIKHLRFPKSVDNTRTTPDNSEIFRAPVLRERVRKGKKSFEFTYDYLIPQVLRSYYQGRPYLRIPVIRDLNLIYRTNPAYFAEYAEGLRKDILDILKGGYNPFEEELKAYWAQKAEVVESTTASKNWDITRAMNYFKTAWTKRGIDDSSLGKLVAACDLFIEWLKIQQLNFLPARMITYKHVELALQYHSQDRSWGNREFNNKKDALRTAFKFLQKEGITTENPAEKVDKKRAPAKKHRYYNTAQFKSVKEVMGLHDPYCLFACQVVYHLAVRSEKELSLIQIKHIDRDRKQVFVPSENAKTDRDGWVPMSDEILAEFERRKIFEYPEDHFLFTSPEKRMWVRDLNPAPRPFKKQFFSHRYMKIRKLAKLSSDHTIFSFRHTRAVHLILDGANIQEIMVLFRHTDIATTSKYLRDLGLEVDHDKINQKTRKF